MSKKFQRKKEDFVCGKCGAAARGDGYTDHCPKCLWSKHVDVNPGDRAADCQGMMKPEGVEFKKGGYDIFYHCAKCGYQHRVKACEEDNFEEILKISQHAS